MDGVCDCCDGSDEGAAAQCPNTCAAMEAAAAQHRAEIEAGRRARDEYASRGSRTRDNHATRTAPHAAYKALDGQCFHSSEPGSEFTYEICLYKSASQKEARGHRRSVSLGSTWSWQVPPHSSPSGADGDGVVGILSGGQMCVGAHVQRSLRLHFVCGAHGEHLSKVSESSTCVYEATLTTPAACT